MDMAKLAKSIFELVNKNGNSCLLIVFDMMSWYRNQTDKRDKYPDSRMPMFTEIESTVRYLLKLAEDNNLNMDKIINWTGDDGRTLFSNAACYSESLASELLKKNVVVVTTVDNLFRIPRFRVSKIFC